MIAFIQEQIKLHEPASDGDPASDETIQQVGDALGVTLPDDYRWFLRTYGSLYWPDYIFGTIGDFNEALNVVQETRTERSAPHWSMPHHLIPIYNDGFGNHDCLDTSRLVDGQCPVVFWNHEAGVDQVPEFTNSSFIAWLNALIIEHLEIEAEEEAAIDKNNVSG